MAESPFGPRVARKTGSAALPAAPPSDTPVTRADPVQPRPMVKEPSTMVPPPLESRTAPKTPAAVSSLTRNPTTPETAIRQQPGGRDFGRGRLNKDFWGTPQATAHATLIQSFARAFESRSVTFPKLAEASALVIQAELRDYLNRTRTIRSTLRARRVAERARLIGAFDALLTATRASGKAIVLAELEERTNIALKYDSAKPSLIITEECRVRAELTEVEVSERSKVVTTCPDFLDDRNEMTFLEFKERNHIAKVRRAELNSLALRHIGAIAAHTRYQQNYNRDQIWIDEASERGGIMIAWRAAVREHRLQSLPFVEECLRRELEVHRALYIDGLQQQLFVSLRTIMVSSTTEPTAEPVLRRQLVQGRSGALSTMMSEFCRGAFFIRCRELSDAERDQRLGIFGIVREESRARGRILFALAALKLQLLQRDSIEDVHCETGGRTSILWEERRARYHLAQKYAAFAAAGFVPAEESGFRLAVLRAERAAWAAMHSSRELRCLVIALEVDRRRCLFMQWLAGFGQLALGYAGLRIRVQEEWCRRKLLRAIELEVRHADATEYLWYSEVRERSLIRSGLERFLRTTARPVGWVVHQLPSRTSQATLLQ